MKRMQNSVWHIVNTQKIFGKNHYLLQKMQIKTILKYNFIPILLHCQQKDKLGLCWDTIWNYLVKLEIHNISCNPTILLLNIYSREHLAHMYQKHIIKMFIVLMFTMANSQKEFKHSQTRVVTSHNGIVYGSANE